MTGTRYLLDTNICIYIRQGHHATLERLRRCSPADVAISVITYGELAFGAEKSQRGKAAVQGLKLLLSALPVLPLPVHCGQVYGVVRASLERQGRIISSNNLWIAAHALTANLILVTNNEREFHRVSGLKIENWSRL